MMVFSEPRFSLETVTRPQYKRAFFRDGGEHCEMCGRPLQGGQSDHILSVSQFPEIALNPRNIFVSCGCGGKLDFYDYRLGRPTVAKRIEMILKSNLKPRGPWIIEAARKRLKPDEYQRLRQAA